MKGRLSFERHQEIGDLLKRMSNDLNKLLLEFGNTYPRRQHIRTVKCLLKAADAVRNVRCFAEEVYAKDYPLNWKTETYYGPVFGDQRIDEDRCLEK